MLLICVFLWFSYLVFLFVFVKSEKRFYFLQLCTTSLSDSDNRMIIAEALLIV